MMEQATSAGAAVDLDDEPVCASPPVRPVTMRPGAWHRHAPRLAHVGIGRQQPQESEKPSTNLLPRSRPIQTAPLPNLR